MDNKQAAKRIIFGAAVLFLLMGFGLPGLLNATTYSGAADGQNRELAIFITDLLLVMLLLTLVAIIFIE